MNKPLSIWKSYMDTNNQYANEGETTRMPGMSEREVIIQDLLTEVLETLRATRKSVISMVVDMEDDGTKVFDTIRNISVADAEMMIQKIHSVRELVHRELNPTSRLTLASQEETSKVVEALVEEKHYFNGEEITKEEYEKATNGLIK